MPSTVTDTRPDQATGFRHISDPANALVEKINATRHPNVVAMHDAIDRWVKEANRLGGEAGLEYLARCAARIEQNRQNLTGWVDDRPGVKLAQGLEGLTIWDIEAADLRIANAVTALREGDPA